MDLDKKRDFVKEIDDELDKSLNAGSLQEKSQKDGSNTLIAEENQLRAEVASLKNKNIKLQKIDSTENQVEEIYKRFLSRVKEECKNAELAIMNIKEKDILFVNQLTNDLEKKSAGCKEVVYDLEKKLNDCGSQIMTMDLDKEGDFAEEIDNELDVTVVFDEDTQYL
ncbi:hypothetical protein RhiirC2_796905 [Rhizophagus irregularis]|uniref:Uncharacterized protein n=1 Tax=Rhizophagus irregularis TaxID=588596 RepID=A0A2N1M8V6_9GLOM|nr:hypothetical protein RhiirC2_796905 [Rhizophagus irregularis]